MTGALVALAAALLAWPGARRPRPMSVGRKRPSGHLPRDVILSPAATAAGVGVIAAVLSTPLVAVLSAGCAALGARAVRRRRGAVAVDAGLLALAEALGVLAAELRAGRALPQAIRTAAASSPDRRTGAALVAVLQSPAAGPSLREVESADLARLRAGVRLSERTGCSLAAVATTLEDDLRARHRLRAELRTATAGPRASAAVLAGLPVVGLAMGGGVGADPWGVLTTTGPGQVLLVLGVLLEVAGVTWAGRLTRRAVPELFPAASRGR